MTLIKHVTYAGLTSKQLKKEAKRIKALKKADKIDKEFELSLVKCALKLNKYN